MKKVAVLVSLLCSGAIVAAAAQRIQTHSAEPHLKQVFPNAVAFSPFGGNPLHYKAYGTDPRQNPSAPPIGFVFWTTDLVPKEQGYHSPIHILVGMNTAGVLTGALVVWNLEPYSYFSIDPPKFAAQFKGKSIRDPFRVGADVDAVSRASISVSSATRAVRDSSRMVAQLLLPPDAVKQ